MGGLFARSQEWTPPCVLCRYSRRGIYAAVSQEWISLSLSLSFSVDMYLYLYLSMCRCIFACIDRAGLYTVAALLLCVRSTVPNTAPSLLQGVITRGCRGAYYMGRTEPNTAPSLRARRGPHRVQLRVLAGCRSIRGG